MVGKWSCNNPLTIEERRLIQEGLNLNMSYRQIGLHCGRAKSVVMRESKRLGDVHLYDADKAQTNFEYIQKRRNLKKEKINANL